MIRITYIEYLASQAEYQAKQNKPELLNETQKMLMSYGYKKSDNAFELWNNLRRFIKEYKDVAAPAILKLHPDKDAIVAIYEDELKAESEKGNVIPSNSRIETGDDDAADLGYSGGAYPKCGDRKRQRQSENTSNADAAASIGSNGLPIRGVTIKEYLPAVLIGAGVLLALVVITTRNK